MPQYTLLFSMKVAGNPGMGDFGVYSVLFEMPVPKAEIYEQNGTTLDDNHLYVIGSGFLDENSEFIHRPLPYKAHIQAFCYEFGHPEPVGNKVHIGESDAPILDEPSFHHAEGPIVRYRHPRRPGMPPGFRR